MKFDTITTENTAQLVNRFYTRVRADDRLGPIFEKAIGSKDDVWKAHLEKMTDFWSSIMLGSGTYSGNPIKKHKGLPPFEANLFDHWLNLFSETVWDMFIADIAEQYIRKSKSIADVLKLHLYHKQKLPLAS